MLSLPQIAKALGGRVSGRQVLAPGPGHSAVDRSLSVTINASGDDVVVHSFAEDDPIACKDFVREKIGLPSWQPKKKHNGEHAAAAVAVVAVPAGPRRVVATYNYVSTDGEVLYEVQRFEPKDFRQRRPLAGGGYSYSLGEVQPVLYRLPELLKYPDATVFITEGEKDADNLAALDLTATTISGSTVWTPELAEPLRDRDVIILADNDTPGMKKATEAANALHGIAKSLRLVLLPDLPDKGDVSDYLAASHGRDELIQVCLAAPVWTPEAAPKEARPINIPQAETAALGEWDAGDDETIPPPRGWLLGNAFCRGFISSVIAEGGTGKSALRLAQLLSLAIGRALTGEHVFMRCRVLIVSLEDNANELRRRLRAACLHHEIDRGDLARWLYLAAPGKAGGKLMAMDAHGRPVVGDLAGKLAKAIAAHQIDIVSLDPFVKAHSVEENSNSAIDDVVQLLADMAEQFDIAIDVPHHAAKGPADPGNANRGRGASAMKDAGRLFYTLTTMSTEEAQALGIGEVDRRHLIRLDSAKVNITPPMTEAKWFKVIGLPIGNGTDLYPNGDNVQTVEPWTPPNVFAGLSNPLINEILTIIDHGQPDGALYSDAPNAKASAAWRVIAANCPGGKSEAECRQIIRIWVKSGLLKHENYYSEKRRENVIGLRVDAAKRPS